MDLSSVVPEGLQCTALHLRTNAYQCKPLTISKSKPLTLKVKHMLLLSDKSSSLIILGIEIYVYLTFYGNVLERHIFVSKADTTGLGKRDLSVASITKRFLRYLIDIDPRCYIKEATYRKTDKCMIISSADATTLSQLHDKKEISKVARDLHFLSLKLKSDPTSVADFLRKSGHVPAKSTSKLPVDMPNSLATKISLFTRSADAYLFPESHRNKTKHILDGKALFSWWISILEDTLDPAWLCKIDIPGSDTLSVHKFKPSADNWSVGNIHVASREKDKAVYTIPLLPDDPKGRFLEHLIVENRYKSMSAGQFWDELGFRQEFRLGDVVGIIGCAKVGSSVSGIPEDRLTTIFTRKSYKKARELMKSENYGEFSDVSNVWTSVLPDFAEQSRTRLNFIPVVGKMHSQTRSEHSTEKTVSSENSNGSLKRSSQNVNNLNNLVKRKKKIQ